jgi:Serine/threonine protein kinase
LIGVLLGHYRIKSAIGAGGMGQVFRATDTTLGREVALKVLPAEMASNPERLDRFKREAKALAALDQPAVVGVYSVEESNGIHFLTMQLVEGQTLEPLIRQSRTRAAFRRTYRSSGRNDRLRGAVHTDGLEGPLHPAKVVASREVRSAGAAIDPARFDSELPPWLRVA